MIMAAFYNSLFLCIYYNLIDPPCLGGRSVSGVRCNVLQRAICTIAICTVYTYLWDPLPLDKLIYYCGVVSQITRSGETLDHKPVQRLN